MACFKIWCRLWPLFVLLTTIQCGHYIREKGSKVNVLCTFKKYHLNMVWQVRAGHDFINVTSCTFGQNICVDHMPQWFQGEVENSSDGFTSYLIINNVRINETEFRCLNRYGYAWNTLEVYARPSNPVCDPVELDYTKKNLQFRCRTTKVFPSLYAILYIRGVDLSSKDILSGHCSNEELSLTMDGYSANCAWRMSAAKLEPDTYKYFLKVFPNLPSTTGISVPTVFSQDYTLQLSSPKAAIDVTRCPFGPGVEDGKITNATTATCRCVLESPGFPVGQARWYTEQGIRSLSREDTTDGSSTLLIYPNATGQSFECRAESSLINPHKKGAVYTPVFTTRLNDPMCDPVELDYTKNDLQFTCRARTVYSSVSAILFIKGVDWLQESALSNHCSNKEHRSLTLDIRSTECTWRVSAAKLEPIKYKYYVKMYPNLPNNTGISIPHVVSQDYTLQLSSPVAVIDYRNCPVGPGVVDGKIINGSTATCKCVLKSPGFPSGQARWYTHNGNQSMGRDDTTDGSSTLVIDTNISDQRYRCRAESALNNSLNWGPLYTPVFTRAASQSCKCRAESALTNNLNRGPVYTPVVTNATTPSSCPETYSLRIELVAGIVAGSDLLTLIIAAVFWKWRSRRRESADMTRAVYNRSGLDAAPHTDLNVYEDNDKVF